MTNLVLTLFLAIGFLVVFYRFAVRPLLKLAFIERLNAAEKYLEILASEGKVFREDFSYTFLKSRLQAKTHLGAIGISGFLHYLVCESENDAGLDMRRRFESEANDELRNLHKNICRDLIRWMIVNSPTYTIIGACCMVPIMIYKSMSERKVMDAAFTFADREACPTC